MGKLISKLRSTFPSSPSAIEQSSQSLLNGFRDGLASTAGLPSMEQPSFHFSAHEGVVCPCGRGTGELPLRAHLSRYFFGPAVLLHRVDGVWAACSETGAERKAVKIAEASAQKLGAEELASMFDDAVKGLIESRTESVRDAADEPANAEDTLAHHRESLRSSPCVVAVATCSDLGVRAVAAQMLSTWTRSADELIAAAEAVVA